MINSGGRKSPAVSSSSQIPLTTEHYQPHNLTIKKKTIQPLLSFYRDFLKEGIFTFPLFLKIKKMLNPVEMFRVNPSAPGVFGFFRLPLNAPAPAPAQRLRGALLPRCGGGATFLSAETPNDSGRWRCSPCARGRRRQRRRGVVLLCNLGVEPPGWGSGAAAHRRGLAARLWRRKNKKSAPIFLRRCSRLFGSCIALRSIQDTLR